MSDKQRVYQGVRVKKTVKELLQRHRSALKTIKMQVCEGRVDIQELCVSTLQGNHVDAITTAAAFQGADVSAAGGAGGTRTLQHAHDASCSVQFPQQEGSFDHQRQFVQDMSLLSGGGGDAYNGENHHNNVVTGASLQLPHHHHHHHHHQSNLALPSWSHEQDSLNADYYYSNPGMAPSPPDSVNLPSPVDHSSSYSPQDSSFSSSSSSSCYNSPSRMDGSYLQGFGPDQYHHYQPWSNNNLQQDCHFMSHCWPAEQDNVSAQEYAPYYGPIDYPYPYPVEDNYFRRDLTPMGSEMCYNVL